MSVRWGVIGSTSKIYQGRLKPAFVAAQSHEIVGEASRVGVSEQPYAELLKRTDVDAVYIPLPNNGHKTWVLRALAAGKHVLCEKPLTLSVADTQEVFAAADAAGKVLLEAYMWPHHPRAQRILQIVADGTIGELRSVRSTFTYPASDPSNHRFDERGAGALFDIGIYCLAPPMLMVGRDHVAVAAVADRNRLGVDESMTGFVDWGRQVASTFEVNFHARESRALELVGSTGVLTLEDSHTPGPENASRIHITRLDGRTEIVKVPGSNAFVGMIDHFRGVVRGDHAPIFGAAQSLRLARVIEALHACSGGGLTPVGR